MGGGQRGYRGYMDGWTDNRCTGQAARGSMSPAAGHYGKANKNLENPEGKFKIKGVPNQKKSVSFFAKRRQHPI